MAPDLEFVRRETLDPHPSANTQKDVTVICHESDAPNKTTSELEALIHLSFSRSCLSLLRTWKKKTSEHLCARNWCYLCFQCFSISRAEFEALCRTFRQQRRGDESYRGSQGECARMQMDNRL